MLRNRSDYAYQAYFCEENVWKLADQLRKDGLSSGIGALFFINEHQTVLLSNQAAFGGMGQGCWDYHVVLFLSEERLIIDFDSALGFRNDVDEYFSLTFGDQDRIDPNLRATVRSVDGFDYLECFWSDRSHMIGSDGQPLAPFPDWPPIKSNAESLGGGMLCLNGLRNSRFKDPRIEDLTVSEFLEHHCK